MVNYIQTATAGAMAKSSARVTHNSEPRSQGSVSMYVRVCEMHAQMQLYTNTAERCYIKICHEIIAKQYLREVTVLDVTVLSVWVEAVIYYGCICVQLPFLLSE